MEDLKTWLMDEKTAGFPNWVISIGALGALVTLLFVGGDDFGTKKKTY